MKAQFKRVFSSGTFSHPTFRIFILFNNFYPSQDVHRSRIERIEIFTLEILNHSELIVYFELVNSSNLLFLDNTRPVDEDDDFEDSLMRMDSRITGEVSDEYSDPPGIGKIHATSIKPMLSSQSTRLSASRGSFEYDEKTVVEKYPRLCEQELTVSVSDFEIIKIIGKGAFSFIHLAR